MVAPTVGIVGMKALRKDIDRLAEDERSPLYAALKAAGHRVAEPVANRTRSTIPNNERSPRQRLAKDVRVGATKTGAAVRMGRNSIPWAGWVEFGGDRPDGSSRDYMAGGRYLFPAARAMAAGAATEYSDAVEAILNTAGIWTNATTDPEAVHD